MADGNLQELRNNVLEGLEVLRDHGLPLLRNNFEWMSENVLGNNGMRYFWTAIEFVEEVYRDLKINIRDPFRRWLRDNRIGGLVLAPDPVVVTEEDYRPEAIVDLSYALLDTIKMEINQIIAIIPTSAQAELQAIDNDITAINQIGLYLYDDGISLIGFIAEDLFLP